MKKVFSNLKAFLAKCKRVWLVLKKPTGKEFQMVAKISALGLLVIGFFGFVISLIMSLFFK